MTTGDGLRLLWPTPIGVYRYPAADTLNPLLVKAFAEGRAVQERRRGEERKAFFASDDDLLHRVKIPEWQDFVAFIVKSLGETAKAANHEAWGGRSQELQVAIEGMWFQCARRSTRSAVRSSTSALEVGEQQLEDRDRILRAPGAAIGVGEVVARQQRLGVLGPERFLAVGEQRLERGDRIRRAPRRPPWGRLASAIAPCHVQAPASRIIERRRSRRSLDEPYAWTPPRPAHGRAGYGATTRSTRPGKRRRG